MHERNEHEVPHEELEEVVRARLRALRLWRGRRSVRNVHESVEQPEAALAAPTRVVILSVSNPERQVPRNLYTVVLFLPRYWILAGVI